MEVIGRADLVEFYNTVLSYRMAHQKEIASLDEFLALSSGKEPKEPKSFDNSTDTFLEQQALKRLAERQKEYGK